jgi:hypothetical protein
MSSIDEKIRIDNEKGNDFTLVDRDEFYKKIDYLFSLGELMQPELLKQSKGAVAETLNNILSYKGKPEDELKKLYRSFYLNDSSSNTITFAAETLLKSSVHVYKKARGNYSK